MTVSDPHAADVIRTTADGAHIIDGKVASEQVIAEGHRADQGARRQGREARPRRGARRRERGLASLCRRQGQGREGLWFPFRPCTTSRRRHRKPTC